MIFFVLLYILWIFLYCVYGYCLFYSHHDKMYALKLKNGWIVESQKKVYIDTALSAKAASASNTQRSHSSFVLLLLLLTKVIIFFGVHSKSRGWDKFF